MKHSDAETPRLAPRVPLTMCLAALAVAFTASHPPPAHADDPKRPPVPPNIPDVLRVPDGNKAFREGDAIGTQDYICLPTGWAFFGPQATLFNEHDEQIITHFLSPNPFEQAPNPFENGLPRATWQDSEDTSKVWARTIASVSVEPGAIPWYLLQVVGAQDGPTGGDELSETTYIQRLNTVGGLAPTTPCTVGAIALVPYTAEYFFYKAIKRTSSR
ncbi:MAG TPA: DUF3455 domain-containing protein [Stellaceae bacterium]|nr:DUF3455 domain-containing protein [Stellaceae bacterium]